MRLQTYSPPKVPSRAGEHIALLFLGLIAVLSAIIGFEIIRMNAFDYAVDVAVMQGLMAAIALGAWAVLRHRRISVEKRKARFYEGLRDG